MKKKRNKPVFNPYLKYTDDQLLASIEAYLIYKKSCEVARMLVVECCHDSYEIVDTSYEECNFNSCLSVALSRSLPVYFENDDLKCSKQSVAQVLYKMCGLELTWLDENRYAIIEKDFISEEQDIVIFYRDVIKELSDEQIKEIEAKVSGNYSLVL